MAEIKISELSIGDWIATESAQLVIECNDIATAFVEKVKKPIQIVSVLGTEQLVFGRIEELDGFTTIYLKSEHIEPIPLTPEILEKNGFEELKDKSWVGHNHHCHIQQHGSSWTLLANKRGFYRTIRFEGLAFVHELQHALRLAGVEKEIEV